LSCGIERDSANGAESQRRGSIVGVRHSLRKSCCQSDYQKTARGLVNIHTTPYQIDVYRSHNVDRR
jgi:hypothetical protein